MNKSAKKLIKSTTINQSILDKFLLHNKSLNNFKQLLSQMIITGFIKDTFASSKILTFSTTNNKCIHFSRKIFDHHIENPNTFIYNTMIRAYLSNANEHCQRKIIFQLYEKMLKNDILNIYPDNYTYPLVVQACETLKHGKQVHCHVIKMGFEKDVYVTNTLIKMYYSVVWMEYEKDDMVDARKVFDESPVRDSVSWNTVLAGYVKTGDVDEAKRVYEEMPEKNVIASNSMIVLLGNCGFVDDAYALFVGMKGERDVVSWTAVISCYEKKGMFREALCLFKEMMKSKRIERDEVVVISVVSACAQHTMFLETGASLHGLVVKTRGMSSLYVNVQNAFIHMYSNCGDISSAETLFKSSTHVDIVSWNSMISGYSKCGSLKKAREVFDAMPEKDVVSWSALISGYTQVGLFDETIELFKEMMVNSKIKPDETILVSVVSSCTHLASLEQGTWVHTYIKKNGLEVNSILGTTLIDMYMKLGCVENAEEVFYEMKERKGTSSWNAMILGLAMYGQVEKALEMFSEMKRVGINPNEITFVAVLGACRHMGLVDEGRHHFRSMLKTHNIEPNIKHYGCMVDLLGRAGLLKEAEELIESMPMEPDIATYGALLGACKKYNANEMGERVGLKLIELQPDHDGFHVLLSNIYASKGDWESVADVRGSMSQKHVVKMPGCSILEANGVVHEFLAGDKSHPRVHEIEEMLDKITEKTKMIGYSPDTNDVSYDVDDEEKETTLFRHSEKLAIAFGLMVTDPPTPVRIMKNLRICNDCHALAKLVSKAFNREIVIRDQRRFHHFREGSCSCMDYW